jgi:hypothetical protein
MSSRSLRRIALPIAILGATESVREYSLLETTCRGRREIENAPSGPSRVRDSLEWRAEDDRDANRFSGGPGPPSFAPG